MTDLAVGKLTGLNYADVRALPREVYEMLVEDLNAQMERTAAAVDD